MTPAINVVNISESKRKELEKTNQPTPFLSYKANISPPVKGGLFYTGIAFKDFNTIGPECIMNQSHQ